MKLTEKVDSELSVVHIHMGPNWPVYFWDTVRQTRKFHAGPIICVLPFAMVDTVAVAALGLTVVFNESFADVEMVQALNAVSWLDARYGGGGFWHFTMLRLFVLDAVMQRLSLASCLHIENDVLIYRAPESIRRQLESCYGARCALVPLGPNSGCTAALMYVGARSTLTAICHEMLRLLGEGEDVVCSYLGSDMVNEMVLLGIIRLKHPELVDVLPVTPYLQDGFPTVRRIFKPWARPFLRLWDAISPKELKQVPVDLLTQHLSIFHCLFDPAFWGQYVGGTPHGDGSGFSASHHWIGNDLRAGRYQVLWRTDDIGRRVPVVVAERDSAAEWPLFNLHIHSKKISDFV